MEQEAMENTLVIILTALLVILIAALCCLIAIGNLARRRRQIKRPILPVENLELLKKQGIITEEEFESIKEGAQAPQELSVESCTLSAEEIMEAIEAALHQVGALETDPGYTGSDKWAEALGVDARLNLSLKELTLLNMKIARSRPGIDLIAEILAINVPVDAIAIKQSSGKTGLPQYRMAARMIWVRVRERLAEPISIQKEIHEKRKVPEGELLATLLTVIMKRLNIPTTAAGFAVILALMVAKTEFGAFSDDDG